MWGVGRFAVGLKEGEWFQPTCRELKSLMGTVEAQKKEEALLRNLGVRERH